MKALRGRWWQAARRASHEVKKRRRLVGRGRWHDNTRWRSYKTAMKTEQENIDKRKRDRDAHIADRNTPDVVVVTSDEDDVVVVGSGSD